MTKNQKSVSSRANVACGDEVYDAAKLNKYRASKIAQQDPVRLYEEKRYESDLKNQAWFFITSAKMDLAFEDYRKKHPVSITRLR